MTAPTTLRDAPTPTVIAALLRSRWRLEQLETVAPALAEQRATCERTVAELEAELVSRGIPPELAAELREDDRRASC